MTATSRTLLALLLTCAPAGCRSGSETPKSGLRSVGVTIGSQTLTLEVADTPDARQTGLMRRDSMDRNHGMIFVFPDEDTRGFYMKNTRIPLDIIFLDANRRVVSIATMRPYELKTTYSAKPAKYAIELNAGVAKETGVAIGDTIELPESARDTSE
jgi:uncharacterized membrane protein (UPF0127 family)